MPEGPELDVGQEGEDNQSETIGMEEMLYASKSTLENAEDGNISTKEYHLKLVTKSGFRYQVGCLSNAIATSNNTAMLVNKLRETFEAVEMGIINEDDYFFELMSPAFYYTSGSYRTLEQMQTTVLALSRTSSSESEEKSPLENNVYTLLASNASYNPKELPFLDLGKAPTYPKKGIRENDIKFQCQARRRTKRVQRKSRDCFGNDIRFQRKAPKRTKEVKMKSLHAFGNDIRFRHKAPRQTKQVKMKSLHVFGNDIKFQCKTPGQTKQVKMKFPHLFGTRSVGGNWSYILMIQLSLVLAQSLLVRGLPFNAEPDSPLTLTVGSDGVIPFACRNEQLSASTYYTVKFEEKDRPFYIDGTFDPEGLMSPDQAERFRVAFFEEGSSMSLEINIVSVSVEDQGTYVVLLIIQGVTPEYHLMKRLVLILIPPGPAICFLMLSESQITNYEVHCHAKPGNGNSTLACFQNGEKIPYRRDGGYTQIVYRRVFWLMRPDMYVSCCSHDIKEFHSITQTSCNQYKYPQIEPENSPVPPVQEIPTKMALTTRPLSMEDNKKQPSHVTSLYSRCTSSRNFNWPVIIVPIMAIFTFACIINLKLKFNSIFKGK